ncbi:MAG: hypothetical protein ACR2NL_04985 [Acidimicrobiia bacterium]
MGHIAPLAWHDYEIAALELLLEPALGRDIAASVVSEATLIEVNGMPNWYEVVAHHPLIPLDWTSFPPSPAVSGVINDVQIRFGLGIWDRQEFGLMCSASVAGGNELAAVERQPMPNMRLSAEEVAPEQGGMWFGELESPVDIVREATIDGAVQVYVWEDIVRVWVTTSPTLVFITVEDSTGRGWRGVDFADAQSTLSIDAPGAWLTDMYEISEPSEWVETHYPRPEPRRRLPVPWEVVLPPRIQG